MKWSVVADHFQYLASVGIIVVCVAAIGSCFLRMFGKKMVVCISLLILTALSVQSFRKAHVYKDLATLFRDTRAKKPAAYGKLFRGPPWEQ